jgi:hypothetical protein
MKIDDSSTMQLYLELFCTIVIFIRFYNITSDSSNIVRKFFSNTIHNDAFLNDIPSKNSKR